MYIPDLYTHNEYFVLPATKRHGKIVSHIENNLLKHEREFALLTSEAMSLVYYGDPTKQCEYPNISLVDIEDICDIEKFKSATINDLANIVPDIILFTTNGFVENISETRVAGFPNLVIEVWSESNTLFDRQKKFDIYKTGVNTEHWYIEQNSNIIKCFMGKHQLEDKNMKDVLHTQEGIQMDIRHLAL